MEGLTINVKFYDDNSGSGQKMRYIRKIRAGGGGGGGGGGGWASPAMDPPLTCSRLTINYIRGKHCGAGKVTQML